MRFCLVTTFYPPYSFGGDAVYVSQLATLLADAGHEVEVVHCVDAWRACGGEPPPQPVREDPRVRVHALRSRFGALSPILTQQLGRPAVKAPALRRILERDFDAIHFHNISLVGGPGVLRLGNAPKLFTLHEHWWVCPTHSLFRYTGELCEDRDCLRCTIATRTPPQLWRKDVPWMARCLADVDLVVAPSLFTARRHMAWMESAGTRVPVEVLPGCTAELVASNVRPDLPQRFFLYVGRLTRAKGVDRLVSAFEKRGRYPLVVVGDGELRRELIRRAPANVRFEGWVGREDLAAYYGRAVALVVPTAGAESFGLVACEALSSGTPVITSANGGTQEIIDETVGLVYADEQQLTSALDRIWTDDALRARLGRHARARWEARYAPAVHLRRYMDVVGRARALQVAPT